PHRPGRRRDRHRPGHRADGVPQPRRLRRRPPPRPPRGGEDRHVNTATAAALVPLLPFAAAALILLTGRTAPGFVRPLAVLPTLAAAVLAGYVAVRQGGGDPVTAATTLAD